jgi:hypothetical protein
MHPGQDVDGKGAARKFLLAAQGDFDRITGATRVDRKNADFEIYELLASGWDRHWTHRHYVSFRFLFGLVATPTGENSHNLPSLAPIASSRRKQDLVYHICWRSANERMKYSSAAENLVLR